MIDEAYVKAAADTVLRSGGFTVLAHEDIRNPGIPDRSVTGQGRTLWFEWKHLKPRETHADALERVSGPQRTKLKELAAKGAGAWAVTVDTRGGLWTVAVWRLLAVAPAAWAPAARFEDTKTKALERFGAWVTNV